MSTKIKDSEMLGTYSYKNGQTKKFKFTDGEGTAYYFKIVSVGPSIATIQFTNAADAHINVPAGFVLRDLVNDLDVQTFGAPTAFFINWVDNYSLKYQGHKVFVITNQKQQSLRNANVADIVPN